MIKKAAIFAKHSAHGASDNIVRSLRANGIDAKLFVWSMDGYQRPKKDIPFKLQKVDPKWEDFTKYFGEDGIIFWTSVTSIGQYTRLFKYPEEISKRAKNVAIYFTSTMYRKQHKFFDEFIDKHNMIRFSTLDIVPYHPKNLTLFQPQQFDFPIEKEKDFIFITHTPGRAGREKKKGTDKINEVIKNIFGTDDIKWKYQVVTGQRWDDTVEIKAKSHIHIGQMTNHLNIGSIGKNSIEAVALGCATVSNVKEGPEYYKGDFYSRPIPVIKVDDNKDLDREIKKIILDKSYREEWMNRSMEFRSEINFTNTGRYILSQF